MMLYQTFDLIYDPEVRHQLQAIAWPYHALIRASIEAQLTFTPNVETDQRKPLQRPITLGARWELRLEPPNPWRLFYRVREDRGELYILAIGVQDKDTLVIGGQEIAL